MVRSAYCLISPEKKTPTFVDQRDPGCYFIMNGMTKVISPIERAVLNKILIYEEKNGLTVTVHSQEVEKSYTNKNMFKITIKKN